LANILLHLPLPFLNGCICTIGRITTSNTTWKFKNHKYKTINRIYTVISKIKTLKFSSYNKIKYSYCSIVLNHHISGAVKIVFIKTKNNLIPIISTNILLTDEEIINIYKRRWNIEQGYKELREYFGFGKEENRIYESLIARITLSFISYNIVSYINRMNHEPQTIGGLFKDLECELNTLALSMELFINILNEVVNIFLAQLISSLRGTVKNQLDFSPES
jgi:transposase